MQFLLATIERRRLLVPIPFALAKFQAGFLQFLPKPLLTPDQVELLRGDAIVSETAKREGRTLEALGIEPLAMAAVVPLYLWRVRQSGPVLGERAGIRRLLPSGPSRTRPVPPAPYPRGGAGSAGAK